MDPGSNDYLNDAGFFLSRVSQLLRSEMTKEQAYDSILNFAFGMERLCQAVLYDIAPVFALETISFEDAVRLSYSHRLIGERPDSEADQVSGKKQKQNQKTKLEWSPEVKSRAIGLTSALDRLVHLHRPVRVHYDILGKLMNYRNVVVHRKLSELKQEDAVSFSLRWFHPLVVAFAEEEKSEFDVALCFGDREEDVRRLGETAKKKEGFDERFAALKAKHREIWIKLSKNPKAADQKRAETQRVFERPGPILRFDCPACGETALLRYSAEAPPFYEFGTLIWSRTRADELDCLHCGFVLKSDTDFEAFDALEIGAYLNQVIPRICGVTSNRGIDWSSRPFFSPEQI